MVSSEKSLHHLLGLSRQELMQEPIEKIEKFFTNSNLNINSIKLLEILKENSKDFSGILQKFVQEALKDENIEILSKLFQRFPKKMKNYSALAKKVLQHHYLIGFNQGSSVKDIVDLDLQVAISISSSSSTLTASPKTSLQGCLDNIVFLIQSCLICVQGIFRLNSQKFRLQNSCIL